MKPEWTGDAELVRVANRTLRSTATAAAVAVVTPERAMPATAGCERDSSFEIGSISKALTGMLYRDISERGLVWPVSILGDLLPLDGEVGFVPLSSLAVHRSGLPGLPPGMHPLRRSLGLWIRGENLTAIH